MATCPQDLALTNTRGCVYNYFTGELFDPRTGVATFSTLEHFLWLDDQPSASNPVWIQYPPHWDPKRVSKEWYTDGFQDGWEHEPAKLEPVQRAFIGIQLDDASPNHLVAAFDGRFPGHQITRAAILKARKGEKKKRARDVDPKAWTYQELVVIARHLDDTDTFDNASVFAELKAMYVSTLKTSQELSNMREKMYRRKAALG